MSTDNKRKLYDALSQDYDMGTYEQFCEDIQDESKRKKLYDATSQTYDYGDYSKFSSQLGFGSQAAAPSPTPATPVEDVKPEKETSKPKQEGAWSPTPMQKAFMTGQVQQSVNRFQSQADASLEQLRNASEYYNRGGAFSGNKPVKGDARYNEDTGKIEQTYLTPTGTVTTDKAAAERETRVFRGYVDNMTVSGQLRRAGRDLQELHRKREERAEAIHEKWAEAQKKNTAPLAAVLGAQTYVPSIQADPEYRALTAAIHQAEKRVQTLQHESDRQNGKDVGFWRGFGEVVGDIKTWDFGYSGVMDAMTMLDATSEPSPNRRAKTEAQKEAEQTMLEQTYEAQQAEAAYGQNDSFWNRAGVMTGEMLPFMLDFAIMGGSKSGTSLVTRNLDAILLRSLHKAAPKVARKKAVQWTTKALGAMPEDLLYWAPLMTNTVQGMKTASDIIDRKLGDVVVREDGTYDFSNDKSWGSAIWQGEANTIIENYSERFGTHLEGLLSLKGAGKLAETFGAKRLSGILTRASNSELAGIAGTMQKHLNQLGVSDYFGEVGEEYYGQLWRTVLKLDDAYKQNPDGTRTNLFLDGQFHGDIWGGMALSMGLIGAGKYSVSAAEYGSMKHRVNKTDKRACEAFTPEVWEGWRERIDGTTNDKIGEIAEAIVVDPSLTDDQKAAAMNYMEASLNLRGFNLASVARQRGGEVSEDEAAANESYMDGYSASTPQEMNDAKRMVELQRERLAAALSEDLVQDFDDDPIGALSVTHDPELRRIASDYVNAKMVYDGMIQRVRDDLDGRMAQSDAMIDSRINRETGMIQPATMKVDDRKVYIVNGNVAMFDDGTGVDLNNSSESVIVRDAETGKVEFVAPGQILSVDDAIDAESEKEAARTQIIDEIAVAAANNIEGVLSFAPGDSYSVLDEDGNEQSVSVLGQTVDDNGNVAEGYVDIQFPDGSIEAVSTADLQQRVDAANERRVAQFVEERSGGLSELPEKGEFGENSVTSQHGNGFEQDNGLSHENEWDDAGGRVATDTARSVEGDRDRSDIRVYEAGLGAERDEYSEYSERARREAESERLVEVARREGQYIPKSEYANLGTKYPKHSGESEVYINKSEGKVYKVKDPSAKSPMKGGVQPEDAIYEHLVHNKYFPETRYRFEGISDDLGDARIVLSQDYIESVGQPTKEQIEAALAERGLYPEGNYRYGNEEVSVTDVTGDNALLGADGKVYFIDPIIDFKKPVGEIIGDGNVEAVSADDSIIPIDTEIKPDENGVINIPSPGAAEVDAMLAPEESKQSALSRVPLDEHGKPDFGAVDADTAWDAIVEKTSDEAMAQSYADNMVAMSEAELKKAEKVKSKPTTDLDEFIAADSERIANITRAKNVLAHWQKVAGTKQRREAEEGRIKAEQERKDREDAERAERDWAAAKSRLDKRLRDTAERYRDVPEALEILGRMEPESVEEVAAVLLSGNRILWESGRGEGGKMIKAGAKYHAGIGEGERRKLFGLFASESNGGVSLESLAEDRFEELCNIYGIGYDYSEALDALIDVIRSSNTMGDIRNYVANRRIAQAEAMGEAVRRREVEEWERYCMEAFHMSAEEWEAFEEEAFNSAVLFLNDFDEQDFYGNIADEIIERQKDGFKEYQRTERTGEVETDGGGDTVLPESQSAETGGEGSTGSERARSGIGDRDEMPYQAGGVSESSSSEGGRDNSGSSDRGAGNDVAGRSLTMEEATDLISQMESNAEVAPEIELTIENWDAQFGEDGMVSTPIGDVKMGENQFAKLMRKGRNGKLGMIKPTLENPDIIIEDASEGKDDTERRSSYVFVKTFIKPDGSRYYYFTSVTVSHDEKEVVVSSQEKSRNRILRLMQEGSVIWRTPKDATTPSAGEQGLDYEQPMEAETAAKGSGLTPQSTPSEGKDSRTEGDMQGNDEKISLRSKAAEPVTLGEQISEAEADVNLSPTDKQKEAGNYKKGHVQVGTFDVTIENPKGSKRSGTDADGNKWETTMTHTYGYIRGTKGVDGDHIDVFISSEVDDWNGRNAFVVDQYNPDGSFDEHKVMLGFNDRDEAFSAYLSNYESGWEKGRRLDITAVPIEEFEKWIESSKRKTKPFAEYKSVKVYKELNPKLSIEPDGFGDFGPVFTQFKGDAQGAVKLLSELEDGEAIGALHHKDIGDIDLVWGEAGTAKSDGWGVAKLIRFHREVVENLQEILDDMRIVKRSDNRINLESDTHKAAVRLTWNDKKKKWLLTAFEKKETSEPTDKRTGTDDNPMDKRGDTALPQDSDVSDSKVNTLSSEEQTDSAESSEAIKERAYEAAKGLLKSAGIEVIEVSDKEANAMITPQRISGDMQGAENQRPIFSMRTYHGTGADFKAFDFSHIGEGEGAQAYGWGGYVTQVKGIGRTYATNIAGGNILPRIEKAKKNIHQIKSWLKSNEDFDKYFRKGNNLLRNLKRDFKTAEKSGDDGDMDFYRGLIELQEEQLKEDNHKTLIRDKYAQIKEYEVEISRLESQLMSSRHLYTVDIPSDNGRNYINWDGTLSDEQRQMIDEQAQTENIMLDFYGDMVNPSEYFDKMGASAVGFQMYRALIRTMGSDRSASDFLSRAGFTGIRYAADHNNGGRADGKSNYVIFREQDMKITDHIRFMRTTGGVVYGWTVGGKVYLNRNAMNPETPLHEYTHLWDEMLRVNNPELWSRGIELMKQIPEWAAVIDDPNYIGIRDDENAVASEVHSRLTGAEGARRLEEMIDTAKADGALATAQAVTLSEQIKEWLREMYSAIKATLSKWSNRDLEELSIDDFIGMTLRDLTEGINPTKVLKKDMQKEKILHISKKLSPSSEWSLTEAPNESEGPDLVPTSDNDISEGKGSDSIAEKQINEGDNHADGVFAKAHALGEKVEDASREDTEGTEYEKNSESDNKKIRYGLDDMRGVITGMDRLSKREQESVRDYLSHYGSVDIVVVSDADSVAETNLPEEGKRELGELLSDDGILGVYCHYDKKIYIFANRYDEGVDGNGLSGVLFHENTHAIVDSLGDDCRNFLASFRECVGKLETKGNLMGRLLDFITTEYDAESVNEEFLAYVVQWAMMKPSRMALVLDCLEEDSRRYFETNIINKIDVKEDEIFRDGSDRGGSEETEGDSDGGAEGWRKEKVQGGRIVARNDAGLRDRILSDEETEETEDEDNVRFRLEDIGDRIENLFNEAVAGNLTGKPVEIGVLTKDGREYLEKLSGIAFKENVSFVINPSDLVHIYRDHFGDNEKDKGNNIPLSMDDIHAISEVICNPERVVYGIEPDGLKRKLFYFLSSNESGAYNLLEIYGDRKGNLTAKTFYKTKKGVSQRVLSLMKSKHLTSVTDGATLSGAKLPKFFELSTNDGNVSFERGGVGAYSDADVSMESDPWSKAWGESLRSKRRQKEFADRERQRMRERVKSLSSVLGVDIEVIEDASSLTGKKRRAKGWYDTKTGKITVVVSNHKSAADMEASILHEAVAHHGLRELLGEHFDEFLDKVYEAAEADVKERIDLLGSRNGWNRRVATEEYLAGLAEDMNFEEARNYGGWWQKVKRLFLKMLESAGFKYLSANSIGDNELRYILWRSYQNLVNPGRYRAFEWEAEDVAMQYSLGVGDYAPRGSTAAKVAEEDGIDRVNDKFNEELEKWANGEMKASEHLSLGKPHGVMEGFMPKQEIILRQKVLTKARKKHGLSAIDMRNLPSALAAPIFVFKSTPTSISVLTELKSASGKNIFVAVELNKDFRLGGSNIEVNDVLTVHGREVKNVILPILDNNSLVWVDKKKGLEWVHSVKSKSQANAIQDLSTNNVGHLSSASPDVQQEIDITDFDSAAKIVENFENPTINEENGGVEDLRFRDGDFTPRDRKLAAMEYERMLSRGSWQFQEAVQDSMLGLKSLYESIAGGRIEDVAGYENAYLYENRMSSTNNAEQHQYFIRYMKPLLESVYKLCGTDDVDRRILTDYMIAKHGLERNEYMRNEAASKDEETDRDFAGLCGLTGEDDWKAAEDAAQKMVDEYERDHDTKELWESVKRATGASLDKLYMSGLISEDTYKKVAGMYDYYIPLRGWDEKTSDEVYGYLTSNDGPLMGGMFKSAKGRKSKADDPIATIAMIADDAIRQGNRNIMKQRFLNFVHGNPSDLVSVNEMWLRHNDVTDEWEPVFADLQPDMTHGEIESEIAKFEAKMEGLRSAEPDKYKRGRDARNIPYKVVGGNLNEHQVLVKRNGRTYVMTINGNPRAAQALNGLTNPDVETGGVVGNLLKAGEYVNRQLSTFYTTRNPDFVVSNFMRDMLYANCMTWVKENPRYALRFHKNVGRVNPCTLGKLLYKWEKGTLSDGDYLEKMFKDFMLNGGETGYTSVRDIEEHKRSVANELKKQGSTGRKAWTALGMQFDLLNRSVENCARFAAYVTSREMGRSIDRSIFDAKEVSVNFNKKGSGGKFVNATGQTLLGKAGGYLGGGGRIAFVFWNAGVQGMTNFVRAGKRSPVKAIGAAAALFTLGYVIPLLAQMAGGGDDDDKNAYYNLPEYVRRSNVCFKAGKQWIVIPLPIEYRAIYGLGELACGVISGNERYSNSELAYQMAGQISQILPLDMLEGGGGISPFIPSAFKPFTEAYIMNKGWTGLPVYRDNSFNKNDPEWTKAYQSTDQHLVAFTRWLNETSGGDDYKKGAIDINPAKLEYLLSGTFGGVVSTTGKLKKMGETLFSDREFEWKNMLIANRVVKSGDERTENRKLQNEYFKYLEEYEETKRLRKKYENASNDGILGYAERVDFLYNSPEYLRYEIFENYKPEIDAIREAIKEEVNPESKKMLQTELTSAIRELVGNLHEAESK